MLSCCAPCPIELVTALRASITNAKNKKKNSVVGFSPRVSQCTLPVLLSTLPFGSLCSGLTTALRQGAAILFRGASSPGGLSCLVSFFVLVVRSCGCLLWCALVVCRFVWSLLCGLCRWCSGVVFLSGAPFRLVRCLSAFVLPAGRSRFGWAVALGVRVRWLSSWSVVVFAGCFVRSESFFLLLILAVVSAA